MKPGIQTFVMLFPSTKGKQKSFSFAYTGAIHEFLDIAHKASNTVFYSLMGAVAAFPGKIAHSGLWAGTRGHSVVRPTAFLCVTFGCSSRINSLFTALQFLDVEKERLLLAERKELVDSLSHEMKTPLGIIRAYAEGLQDETDRDKQQKYAQVIVIAAVVIVAIPFKVKSMKWWSKRRQEKNQRGRWGDDE